MTPKGVVIGQYSSGGYDGYDIAAGSDGAMYVSGGYTLTRVTMQGRVTVINQPNRRQDIFQDIVSGPDGNLWISAAGKLVVFDPATQTWVTRIKGQYGWGPLIAGPDGNIWRDNGTVDIYVRSIIVATPKTVTLKAGQSANLNVSETNYDGQWTAIVKHPSIATVTPNSTSGIFVVTGVAPGTTFMAVYDSMFNSIAVKVTVQ
jgi:hypothetical protein